MVANANTNKLDAKKIIIKDQLFILKSLHFQGDSLYTITWFSRN